MMPEECAEAGSRESSNRILSYIHYCRVGISVLSVRKGSLLLTGTPCSPQYRCYDQVMSESRYDTLIRSPTFPHNVEFTQTQTKELRYRDCVINNSAVRWKIF